MKACTLALLILATAVQSGCAYLTTYNHPIDLKEGSVALDVKQRVVFSQVRHGQDADKKPTRDVVVCAEPSPDALTVLGASGGLSLSNGEQLANASAGLAESGAFVGLRTQSIQLLRDAMYRLCEGYAAGAVSTTDYAAMQRRYQSTMMGLIAIEQLTRPVVASQVLLTSSASAQAGATAGDTTAIDKAQQRADTAKAASLDAQQAVDDATAQAERASAALHTTLDKIAAEKKAAEPDATVITALEDQLPALRSEEAQAQRALVDARRRALAADESARVAQASLRAAQAKVSASASGGGALGAIAASAAQSTEHLTQGVVDIVSEINASYTKDACLALMIELVKNPQSLVALNTAALTNDLPRNPGATGAVLNTSLQVCGEILKIERNRTQQRMSADRVER